MTREPTTSFLRERVPARSRAGVPPPCMPWFHESREPLTPFMGSMAFMAGGLFAYAGASRAGAPVAGAYAHGDVSRSHPWTDEDLLSSATSERRTS